MPATPSNEKQRRRYREAYPRFNLRQAIAALKGGPALCEFIEPWDEIHGWARCEIAGDRCHLWYDLKVSQTDRARTRVILDLVPTSNGIVDCRMMIACPECGMSRQDLFFKDKWACHLCLGLRFRSQLLPAITNKWEKIRALNKAVERGRPHGTWNKSYDNIVKKRDNLTLELYGKTPQYGSEKFSYCLKSVWRPLRFNDEAFLSILDATSQIAEVGTRIDPAVPVAARQSGLEVHVKCEYVSGYETTDPEDL